MPQEHRGGAGRRHGADDRCGIRSVGGRSVGLQHDVLDALRVMLTPDDELAAGDRESIVLTIER